MDTAVIKTSHQDKWLQQGHILCLQFAEGWFVVRINGREPTNVKPYQLAAALASLANLAAWNTIMDANVPANRLLEPPDQYVIHQIFWGVSEPRVRIYQQFQSRDDVWSLIGSTRTIQGDVGYVDGVDSPFEGPFSDKTELFTLNQIYPAYNAYNPLPDAMTDLNMNFDIMRYDYTPLTNRDEVKAILLGERRRRMYTMGSIGDPVNIPQWMRDSLGGPGAGVDFLKYTKAVMSEATP